MGAGGPDKEWGNFETRISDVIIQDIDTLDVWNIPGKQVVRVAPGHDLGPGRQRRAVLQESLPH